MERETGIEPATSSLGSWRSTAELLPLTSKVNRITRSKAPSNLPDALQEDIRIIIPGELICKETFNAIVTRSHRDTEERKEISLCLCDSVVQ